VNLLGLSGKKGSGKSTLARLLCQHRLLTVVRPLAQPLKELCVGVFGLDRAAVYGEDGAKNARTRYRWLDLPTPPPPGVWVNDRLTVREFMQYVGTNVIRRIHPTAWVESLLKDAEAMALSGHLVVVDDVRFPDEVRAIQSAGGKVVRLLKGAAEIDHHVSETALDNFDGFDAVIDNSGQTPEETLAELRALLRTWDTSTITDGATA
jgi:hypothetical protein